MAGKRKPASDLNRDNWDHEEPPEDRGEFVPLSEEDSRRQGRKILKGRRTLGARRVEPETGADRPNPFAGFAGFQSTATAATPAAPGFGSGVTATPAKAAFSFGIAPSSANPLAAAVKAFVAQPPVAAATATTTTSTTSAPAPGGFSFSPMPAKPPSFGVPSAPKPLEPLKPEAKIAEAFATPADEKYAKISAVGGVGGQEKDIKLSGDEARRKAYAGALCKLNECFLWKVFETIGIADSLKALLTRAQVQELINAERAKSCTILSPVLASYNKALESLEKDFPEFAVVFRKDLPGAGANAKESENYSKKLKAEKDATPAPAPAASSLFEKPPAVSSGFGAKPLTSSFTSAAPPPVPSKEPEPAPSPSPSAATFSLTHGHTSIGTRPTDSFTRGDWGTHSQPSTTNTLYAFGQKTSVAPTPSTMTGITATSSLGTAATTVASTFTFGSRNGGTADKDGVAPTKPSFSFGGGGFTMGKVPESGVGASLFAAKPLGADAAVGFKAPSFGTGAAAAAGSSEEKKDGEEEKAKMGYSFGASAPSLATFSFKPSGGEAPKFSFGTGATAGFSFNPPAAMAAPAAAGEDDDGEYEPPVVEEKEIVEEGSFFNTKVKLFYKVSGQFVSKGVGFLFLKKLESGDVQVLVRADNSARSVIFNVKAASGQQVMRMEKNNVLYVCVANPPADPKAPQPMEPTPVLIRTGKSEEADQLCDQLSKAVAGPAS